MKYDVLMKTGQKKNNGKLYLIEEGNNGERSLKLSKFNHFFEVDDRKYFYNTRSGAIAEISEDFFAVINAINEGDFDKANFSKELIDNMFYAGAVVEDDYDEFMSLAYQNNKCKYREDRLIIAIFPTFECNCRCGYCYEKKQKGVISQKVKDGILNFVKNKKNLKLLNIVWFGGEPLLYREHVFDLSDKLLNYCNEHDVAYSCSMVTNLTLLQASDVEKLKKYKIFNYQVTLDGPEDIHNKRRPEINETNSFKKIITNIKLLLSNGLRVDLRVNIDRSNIEHVPKLLEIIKSEIGHNKYLTLYPARVGNSDSNICKSAKSNCIDNVDDWSDITIDFFRQCIKLGLADSVCERIIPKSVIMSCSAEFANYFAVDPDGYLYKCSLIVGQKDKAFQNVCDSPDMNVASSNYLKWVVPSYTQFNKCNECKLSPICMGGCRLLYCNTQKKNPECAISISELNKYLTNFIRFKLI